ncbi:retron St85 family RNA-directed DNA polymerase [Polycyclovorans algicola]|uniref:retron St85 family RNA-directed DNA polymerase n=1 Tax=Polycyclovorans algicola TaxID=616992 RepID=UPI000A0283F0|nr:retron St85 family RNA-directed DNA polymerase [Polycyclovorans algicola]
MRNSRIFQEMAEALGMLPGHLEKIVRTAPLRYKKFSIPKRDGTPRLVAQPAREVKLIQRWLISNLRDHLPVHPSATAYEKGSSIVINASAHQESNYFIKMDFQNFFPSIKGKDIDLHLQSLSRINLSQEDRDVVVRSCTWAPHRIPPLELCIGAPSSPVLSNSILFEFDCAVESYLIEEKLPVRYTRYADDLTFSSLSGGWLHDVRNQVKMIVRGLEYPKLRIKEEKTVLGSRAGRRVVTGLVLTPDKKLSVGRERKRTARAMYHRFWKGELDESEVMQLEGLLAFVESVEPGFKSRLQDYYRKKNPAA